MPPETCRIPLRAADDRTIAHALVDAADYEHLNQWGWFSQTGYAARVESRKVTGTADRVLIMMHRYLLGLEPGDGQYVDHVDRNRLNNTRTNLRVCTIAENQQNLPSMGGSSRFRGVSYDPINGKWRAQVVFGGQTHWLGRHPDEIAAAQVADAFRLEHMPFAQPDPELAAALANLQTTGTEIRRAA